MTSIRNIAIEIANNLEIIPSQLIDLISSRIDIDITIRDELVDKIKQLLAIDNKLNKIIKKLDRYNFRNLEILKKNLGKLQLLILMKKLTVIKNGPNLINEFIKLLTEKIAIVNKVLIQQHGGGGINKDFNNYYNLYLKYKILKYKINSE